MGGWISFRRCAYPPLRLGTGSALCLSPDGAWLAILTRPFAGDSELLLVPTGPGEPRQVDQGGLDLVAREGSWVGGGSVDDGWLLVTARSDEGPSRLYRLPLDGRSAPVALTPTDFPLATHGHCVSPDGRRVIARPSHGAAVAFDSEGGGPARLVPGLQATDLPLRMDRDGRHLYVQVAASIPSDIFRVDTVGGGRTLWRTLAPLDRSGVSSVDRVSFSADGAAYIYSIRRCISRLQLVTGLH